MRDTTPEDQQKYEAYFPAMADELAVHGIASVAMGSQYTAHDFVDRSHLSVDGGYKLAEQVAPQVRKLAGKLGYLEKGER